MSDPVNHPAHYTAHPSGVECITIARHMTFNLGNVLKYIWRADLKGATLQDLKKARFYLDDEIALMEGNAEPVPSEPPPINNGARIRGPAEQIADAFARAFVPGLPAESRKGDRPPRHVARARAAKGQSPGSGSENNAR